MLLKIDTRLTFDPHFNFSMEVLNIQLMDDQKY
jgi:hypothetical protein